MDRRGYLGALATAGVVSLAGCSDVAESVADATLENVNVSSEIDEHITIPVTIEGPNGGTVFDRSPSFTDSGDTEQYEDVWETTGDHTVYADVEDEDRGETAEHVQAQQPVTEPVTIPHPDASLIVECSADGFEIGIFEQLS